MKEKQITVLMLSVVAAVVAVGSMYLWGTGSAPNLLQASEWGAPVLCVWLAAAALLVFLRHRHTVRSIQKLSKRIAEVVASGDLATGVPDTIDNTVRPLALQIQSLLVSQRESEAKLAEARELVEQTCRSQATFATKVSHELRTPMSSIIGMLRILLKHEKVEAKKAYIAMATGSAHELLETIDEILDFSEVEAGALVLSATEFTLRETVREALYLVAARIEKRGNVELLYDIAPDVPDVFIGDPLRVKQTLVHLLANAAKFTTRGSITALVYAARTSAEVVEVCFEVRDTGVGIAPEDVSRIFKPFTQADDSITRAFSGTGLGLTIVKQTVEAMGGSIAVQSAIEAGAIFTVTIPLRRPHAHPHCLRCSLPAGARVAFIGAGSSGVQFLAEKCAHYQLRGEVLHAREIDQLDRFMDTVSDYHLVVVTSDAFEAPNLLDRVVMLAVEKRRPLVVVLSPFEIALREQLSALGVPHIMTRPVSIEDIVLEVLGVASDQPRSRWLESDEAALVQTKRLRVLVVDDVRTNRIILSHMLEDAGHTVSCLDNGLDLVQAVERSLAGGPEAERFDVVVTDVQMPLMDGLTAARKIRELEKSYGVAAPLPIFAVSAHALQEDAATLMASGLTGVLSKPIEPKRLAAALSSIVGVAREALPTAAHSPRTKESEEQRVEGVVDLVARLWRQVEAGEQDDAAAGFAEECSAQQMLDIRDIYSRVGESMERVQLVLRAFSGCFREQLSQLVSARSSESPSELRLAAHAMKGLLLDVGAKHSAGLASSIESLCQRGEGQAAGEQVTVLTQQVLTVARLIERILESTGADRDEDEEGEEVVEESRESCVYDA
jgi:signal transduction histidine kinase/CheY-like chemotaxis protein/HPt (histidine-containing phosphotransfer) domain-containing protein